ncbi:phage head closure protein [Phenylobacterium sp.]|uniref:phage head closure protein n=1 Tax=Phenylobacterium sp. TaxID=1871053 RepID=UPI0027355E69|nr:phage head closure protein [Phenylobacterium sp.]MDP3853621.1 phage head closure protein [Phenylobacterium sp.]
MRSRTRDRRVTIRRAVKLRDGFNAKVPNFTDLVTVWASKEDVKDGERVRAQQVGASITTRFEAAWSSVLSTVDPRDQVSCEGRLYQVVAAKEIGRKRGIEISAIALAETAAP